MNKEQKKTLILQVTFILIGFALISTFGGLTGKYVSEFYRINCDALKPNVSYTETSCIAFNQSKVFVLIKNCERKDIAFIAPRSNESANYYKTWMNCWYPDNGFSCWDIYPGMPLELNITISYKEPKVFQMWRDVKACERELSGTRSGMVLFSIFFSIFGAFWIFGTIAMICHICSVFCQKK